MQLTCHWCSQLHHCHPPASACRRGSAKISASLRSAVLSCCRAVTSASKWARCLAACCAAGNVAPLAALPVRCTQRKTLLILASTSAASFWVGALIDSTFNHRHDNSHALLLLLNHVFGRCTCLAVGIGVAAGAVLLAPPKRCTRYR